MYGMRLHGIERCRIGNLGFQSGAINIGYRKIQKGGNKLMTMALTFRGFFKVEH